MQDSFQFPNTIEVCLTPALFSVKPSGKEVIVVLSDILRATTSICTAFENRAKSIIPVATLDEARQLKKEGYLVASEQDGKKLDFADFGNSAFSFTREAVEGKTLVYCTTNGTRALEIAKPASKIAIGAFINLSALASWLVYQDKSIVVLCSGWKGKFCLEDTLFAGALTEKLLGHPTFETSCDSAFAAMDLWNIAKSDLFGYIKKAEHYQRLKELGLDDVVPYSFRIDLTGVIPVFENNEIVDVSKHRDKIIKEK
jgi:2-phosphosulfolactate phosphatase